MVKFQSTHPLGVRLIERQKTRSRFCGFNPRTHSGCDPLFSEWTRDYQGFNPRTHSGCDFDLRNTPCTKEVSIHAPTRGATGSAKVLGDIQIVSIHAPTRGATPISRESSDDEDVSIHAPTRGATLLSALSDIICTRFNPRTHSGCDV